jgi:hypothetical protein
VKTSTTPLATTTFTSPKTACPLNDDHNLTLATKAFPAEAAAARSPSWQATQTRLSASPPLKALLTTINPP